MYHCLFGYIYFLINKIESDLWNFTLIHYRTGAELFIAASAVTCGTQKRALLLHCAGPNVQNIFGTLSNTGLFPE